MSVLEIVFVGQYEVFVCLDYAGLFFFSPGRKRGVNSLKKCRFFQHIPP